MRAHSAGQNLARQTVNARLWAQWKKMDADLEAISRRFSRDVCVATFAMPKIQKTKEWTRLLAHLTAMWPREQQAGILDDGTEQAGVWFLVNRNLPVADRRRIIDLLERSMNSKAWRNTSAAYLAGLNVGITFWARRTHQGGRHVPATH